MNDFPTNVKEKLNSIISDMADHHWLFSNNPGHDFMVYKPILRKIFFEIYNKT